MGFFFIATYLDTQSVSKSVEAVKTKTFKTYIMSL